MNDFSVLIETDAGAGPALDLDAFADFAEAVSDLSGVDASVLVTGEGSRSYSATINGQGDTPEAAAAAARETFEQAARKAGLPLGEVVVHPARPYAEAI